MSGGVMAIAMSMTMFRMTLCHTVKRAKNKWRYKKQIVLFRGIAIPS